MTTAALKASLALWRRRLKVRQGLAARARQDLLEARTADVHPRQDLVDRKLKRETQLAEALRLVQRRETQLATRGKGVRRPFERVKRNVKCRSSRGGVTPRLIVLHSTEGSNIPDSVRDLQGLGDYFDRPANQASSHVGVDSDGYSARYVKDGEKAWTQAAYNPQSLAIEQIGYARQMTWPEAQLRKTAMYVAFWSQKYDIPIVKSTSHGVCEHKMLGLAGGGHVDCGPHFPFDRVLAMAEEFRSKGW